MAFMFETCFMMKVTEHACQPDIKDNNYVKDSWSTLKKHFNPNKKAHALEEESKS